MEASVKNITRLILEAGKRARAETRSIKSEPAFTAPIKWPVTCTVGPGLEGAIACESEIGYVNGAKGELIYRGYDIYELCAYSTFEEVSYLLLHGKLPSARQLQAFKLELRRFRHTPDTIALMMNFPIKYMNAMAILRMGTNFMRQESTYIDRQDHEPDLNTIIGSDEDSIPMETLPRGEKHAIYEFDKDKRSVKAEEGAGHLLPPSGFGACYRLISGVATVVGAVARLRDGKMPLEPDPNLSHAANLLYMITGVRPTPVEEKIMDVSLILHADHGMNASTFATMVVASTLSDLYFAVGSGIAALNGPLHGGANEQVIRMLKEIGTSDRVDTWFAAALAKKKKIMGFGHRVYKAYDPRARVLGPLAEHLVSVRGGEAEKTLFATAKKLEKKAVSTLGKEKKIFPNVDFYSGIVYSCLSIPAELFTPIFAVSRVAGWTARVIEYLQHNRIFRPRAMYTGSFGKKYIFADRRHTQAKAVKTKKK